LRSILVWLIAIGLMLNLSACKGPEPGPYSEILRVGILPDESRQALQDRHRLLFEFLAQETGLSYELIIPDSYEELMREFGEGQIDLAYFGGVTFVKASTEYGAVPLVMRDVDARFTSVLVVGNEGVTRLSELQGKRFSFGSRLSTSGHLMPRYFMQSEQGIVPEKYFVSIHYSGKHDLTAYRVRDGKADGGIMNAEILRTMLADGRLQPDDIRIVWTTPPYADYVWAIQPHIHPVDRERIQQAFLKLSFSDPQHKPILSSLGTVSFYPSSIDDFSMLRQIVASLEML
jgi:phosphonate transport system substrate-binding protein